MRKINIGAQGFDDLREHNDFYIDKTGFIREWWEDRSQVTLITRPRRFGKTLNMSMLNCFFSNQYAGRSDLFEGLEIWKDERYRQLQGTYPVIFLSLANVKENTYANAREAIARTIGDLFQRLKDQWRNDPVSEKARYSFMEIGPESSDVAIQNSLHDLSAYMEFRYGKKVLILLDEYDTPLQEAFLGGYWKELSNLVRGLFNSTFKTNPSLERAVMTGITRISKESIFSELNNPAVVTTTSEQYASSFGFTEGEVSAALEEYGLTEQKEDVRKWYDGFTFGNVSDIYNPWSIINYLRQRKFAPYWANTSSNALIGYELQKSDIITKDQMVGLMNGGTVQTRLDEQIIYSQLDENAEALWSLFLASGYCRVVQSMERNYEDWYDLAITNMEVQVMFRNLIGLWFNDVRVEYGEFMQCLISGDIHGVEECLSNVLLSKAGFFDTKKEQSENRRPESFYHGLVLGMVAQEQEYYIESNGESGLGRYDVMMIPKEGHVTPAAAGTPSAWTGMPTGRSVLPAIIIEFKLFDSRKEKTLQETAQRALKQISERCYDTKLLDLGFRKDQILQYGFGFSGKKLAVRIAERDEESHLCH